MKWRLLLQEYGPEIEYIRGSKNIVVDVLSRLPKQGDIVDEILPFMPLDENMFLVHLKDIKAKQVKDRDLRLKINTNPSFAKMTIIIFAIQEKPECIKP